MKQCRSRNGENIPEKGGKVAVSVSLEIVTSTVFILVSCSAVSQ